MSCGSVVGTGFGTVAVMKTDQTRVQQTFRTLRRSGLLFVLCIWFVAENAGALVRTATALGTSGSLTAAWGSETTEAASRSRYVNWMTGELNADVAIAEKRGCKTAEAGTGGTSVLAFGRQVRGIGTRSFTWQGNLYPYNHLEQVALAYMAGMERCTTGPLGALAVTTSNYHLDDVDEAALHGRQWQEFVNRIREANHTKVVVSGGIDLEPGWGGADAARSWMVSWRAAGETAIVVNASADGCPASGAGGNCANGWNTDLLAELTWGRAGDLALPQIYRHDGVQAAQWGVLSRVATRSGLEPQFAGAMTQVRACSQGPNRNCAQLSLDPDGARTQLQAAVGNEFDVPHGTDIGWG